MAAPPTKEVMSQKSSGPLSKFNLALALLWLVNVVVTGAGYLILTSSNAAQADFYTSQSSDYVSYFGAQTGSTLGATLIGAGVTGILIALATHAVNWAIARHAAAVAPAAVVETEPDFDFDDDLEETAPVQARAAGSETVAGVDASTANTATDAAPAYGAAVAAPDAETSAAGTDASTTGTDARTGDEPTDEPNSAR
jgi:hypothetical protein